MISEHKIGVKTNSQINHGFDFLKRENLIIVHNMVLSVLVVTVFGDYRRNNSPTAIFTPPRSSAKEGYKNDTRNGEFYVPREIEAIRAPDFGFIPKE